jgi:hypothetical protein
VRKSRLFFLNISVLFSAKSAIFIVAFKFFSIYESYIIFIIIKMKLKKSFA